MSAPPKVFAALNGKYKYAALHELVKVPGVELRLSFPSGRPVDPYYLPLLAAGAKFYSFGDWAEMFRGADVVLSYAASEAGLCGTLNGIRQAKEAGVKLFIPCEYSLEFDDYDTTPHVSGRPSTIEDMQTETYPLVKLRREAVAICKEISLPCLRVLLGIVPENFLCKEARHPFLDEVSSYGWDLENRKVTIIGDGNQPITFTPKEYYRAWFTHLITTTPLEDLQKMETAYLGGETLTQNEVIKIWENKHREQLDVTYSNNLDERETRMKQNRVHNYWTQWPDLMASSHPSNSDLASRLCCCGH